MCMTRELSADDERINYLDGNERQLGRLCWKWNEEKRIKLHNSELKRTPQQPQHQRPPVTNNFEDNIEKKRIMNLRMTKYC